MARRRKPPSYRRRTIRGREIAVVCLPDSATKRRQDFWLGDYGSPESREKYARLLAEWEARGRRLLITEKPVASEFAGPTVTMCIADFLGVLPARYPESSEQDTYRTMLRVLRELFGETPIADFGPRSLMLVRDAMVQGRRADDGTWARAPWSRKTINGQIHRLRSFFRWCVSQELLSATVWESLRSVESLRRGQSPARESAPILPVPRGWIDAAMAFMRPQVRAMVELQLLTGMRPGEVVQMRTCDIEMSGKVWTYRPVRHKAQRDERTRKIWIGPQVQQILKQWLRLDVEAPLFQPAEAVESHRTERRTANYRAKKLAVKPTRPAGKQYTVCSYRRAIERACDMADRAAVADAIRRGDEINLDARLIPRWRPHQLRHNYATDVRREFGLEAAQILLGHSSALVTEAVYAERDESKAMSIVGKIG